MESLTAIKLITFFYILFNSGRVFSYIPQIIAVFKEQTPVLAISLVTWSFWTAANLTTALYATVVLPDPLLAAMSYGNTFGCAVVVFLVVYKRYKYNYWPKSKRSQIFTPHPVTSFTEVPNLDAEEIYHFFDVSDDSNENHTVTFSKKFTHENIDTFESFMEMAKEAEESFKSETINEVLPSVIEEKINTEDTSFNSATPNLEEVVTELPITSPKKRTRKKKETVLIQVETKIDEVKQEVEIISEPTPAIIETAMISENPAKETPSVAISPLPALPVSKKTRNSRRKK